jgi:hypothetical protein
MLKAFFSSMGYLQVMKESKTEGKKHKQYVKATLQVHKATYKCEKPPATAQSLP